MTQRMELQEGVVLGGGISFSTGPDDMRLILTLAAAGKRYLRAHRVTVLDLTDACSWRPIMCSSPPPPAAPHRCRTLRPPGPRQRPPRCRHLVLGSGIARCSFPVKDGRELAKKICVPCNSKDIHAMPEDSAKKMLEQVGGWELATEGDILKLHRAWKVKNFVKGLEFLQLVAAVAEEEGHHPDLHLVGWNNVKIDVWTHSVMCDQLMPVTGDSDSDQPVPTRCKQARDSVRRAKGKGTT
ncbi:hypothetical protein OsI_03156 [Oryza sativa Indica Group]|uniref:4a-hydroxytetrahydrobiopterin dehydratase n=1 Tax=Oryza sativa subsp. indica TaxID=39946 RepID=B8A794_ORYSI|nr:hypothetical protein OsI_03156 [Oryza sativa Indica Group]